MPPLLDAEVKPFEDAFLKGLCWSVFEIPPKSFDERRSMAIVRDEKIHVQE